MPNQHHPDKEVLGFYVPRTLAAKIRREAKNRDVPVTRLLEEILTYATQKTNLTEDDQKEIAMRKARKLRSKATGNSGSKATKDRPT